MLASLRAQFQLRVFALAVLSTWKVLCPDILALPPSPHSHLCPNNAFLLRALLTALFHISQSSFPIFFPYCIWPHIPYNVLICFVYCLFPPSIYFTSMKAPGGQRRLVCSLNNSIWKCNRQSRVCYSVSTYTAELYTKVRKGSIYKTLPPPPLGRISPVFFKSTTRCG